MSVSDQRAVVVHLSIDQVAIRERRRTARSLHDLLDDIIIVSVVPISEKDRANINIIWNILGAVDDHGCATLAETSALVMPRLTSDKTGIVLSAVVRVIPGSAVEISGISICHAFPWSNRALLNRGYTVVPGCRFL